jgi:hypothetical protein
MMTNDSFDPKNRPGQHQPSAAAPSDAQPRGRPVEMTDLELEEVVTRIGRGVRALVSDSLIDPLPQDFQRLLERLERSERMQ